MAQRASEALADFSPDWCQQIIKSPGLVEQWYRSPDTEVLPNRFFNVALGTSGTIRAWRGFLTKKHQPPGIARGYVLLLSLGNDLNGYRGITHGGMFGVLVDQIASLCAVAEFGSRALTREEWLKFKKAIPLPSIVKCNAVATKREGNLLWVESTIEDGMGKIYCEGTSIFSIRKAGSL